MKLTKKGEYALRAMIALAREQEQPMTITQVADAQQIPKKFLEQILLALKGHGLVMSKAGPRGGYVIAPTPPDRPITVGRILEAVEEPLSQTTSPPEEGTESGTTPTGVAALLEDIRSYIRRKLETVTLDELAAHNVPEDQVEALMWYI